MRIRNTSVPGEDPILELASETKEDSIALKHFFMQTNSGKRIFFLQVVSENRLITSARIGFQKEEKLSVRGRFSLAIQILFNR